MATNRLETLRALAAQNPSDAFVRYGLAMEFVNSGHPEQAIAEFHNVLAINPGYIYAYFHGGQTLEKLGRVEEAGQLYEKGIAMARQAGDHKGLSELQGALELLPL